jgi:hypothetical protein
MTEERKRSDEHIFAHRLDLQFGATTYAAKVLSHIKAAQWREKAIASTQSVVSGMDQPTNGMDGAFFAGLGKWFIAFPEKMVELMKEYAPDLPWDEIMEEATDEEIEINFARICEVGFPSKSPLQMMGPLGAILSVSAKLSK